MSTRTASLLMMFVAALIATTVLLAVVARMVDGTGVAGAWLLPLIAVICQAVALFAGRHSILPRRVADAPGRAAVTVVTLVVLTMLAAVVTVSALQWLAETALGTPVLLFAVWFVLLWMSVQRQALAHTP